jgi:hypothetical protein
MNGEEIGAGPEADKPASSPSAKADYVSVRLISDREGVRLIDARGRPVQGVIGVDMALRPGKPSLMRLNMMLAVFEVEGTPVWAVVDPQTNQIRPIRRIEFADGGTPFEAPEGAAIVPPAPMPPAAVSEITPEKALEMIMAAQANGAAGDPARGVVIPVDEGNGG